MHKISLFITIITALLPLHRSPPLNVLSMPFPSYTCISRPQITPHPIHPCYHAVYATLALFPFPDYCSFRRVRLLTLHFFFVANDCVIGSERASEREWVFGRWMDGDRIGQPARPDLVRRLNGGRGTGKRGRNWGLRVVLTVFLYIKSGTFCYCHGTN